MFIVSVTVVVVFSVCFVHEHNWLVLDVYCLFHRCCNVNCLSCKCCNVYCLFSR